MSHMTAPMKSKLYRLAAALLFILLTGGLCICAGAAYAGGDVAGVSPGAMSPNPTSQSHGARVQETALGNFVADALRQGSGADIAIECGGHLVQSLPGGALTRSEILRVFDADRQVCVATVDGDMLFELLEYAVSSIQIDDSERIDPETGADRFPQISGFSFTYDASQSAGHRMRDITLDDGTELARGDGLLLTVALPTDCLDGTLGFYMLTGLESRIVGTQAGLLEDYIRRSDVVVIPRTGRIKILGAVESTIYNALQMGKYLPFVILLILLVRFPRLRGKIRDGREGRFAGRSRRMNWRR